MRQTVVAIVRKPAVAPRPPPEQPVQRRSLQPGTRRHLLVHGLLKSRRRLACRRGECDQRRPGARARRLRDQLRHHPSDSRRLSRTGAAGDHLQAAARGHVVEVRGDRALLAPVAVEIEPAPEQPQRPRLSGRRGTVLADGDQRAASQRAEPLVDPAAKAAPTGRPARLTRRSRCRGSWPGRRTRGRAAGRAPRAQPPAGRLRPTRRPVRRAAQRHAHPPPTAPRSR